MYTVLVLKIEDLRGLVSMDEAIELVEKACAVNAGVTNLLLQQRQIMDWIEDQIFPVVKRK